MENNALTAETICPICDGTGWKTVKRAGLEGVLRCDCSTATRTRNLIDSSNIPPNYRNATLETFQIPQVENPIARENLGRALREVKAFVREFPLADPPGLLMSGGPGAGKTHLAIAAMKELLKRGFECVFFDYQNLLDRIRSSYNAASGASDREAYRSALEAEVLVLDDLGAHRVTDWVEDTVTSIITYRCNQRKPLIATTNLEMSGQQVEYVSAGGINVHRKNLAETIGTRAHSRLFEMCRQVRIFDVEDFRTHRGRR